MTFILEKSRCPECARKGLDTTGDNLVKYTDGHSYCYSCGYYIPQSGVESFKRRQGEVEENKSAVYLPEDCSFQYPQRALDWVAQYELDRHDLLSNNALWSEKEQRVFFPVYGDGFLIAYQGRDFSLNKEEKRAKWWGKGNLKDTFNIMGEGNKIALVEDIISAIKVKKAGFMSMPLYGSFVGKERFRRLFKLFGRDTSVKIWLDPDKRAHSIIEARLGELYGLKCGTTWTDKDPKEMSMNSIKEIMK